MAQEKPLPTHRVNRLLKRGLLAGRIAGETLSEGARTLASGKPLRATDLMLTPANARHVADRLSEMRGAAMKVGQLLSMEAGDYLPTQLTGILNALFESAPPMPQAQVAQLLQNAWGTGWEAEFKRFSFTPVVASSFGQVHEATTRDDRHLAVKMQYPGVRHSIDSDIDNVATLFRLFRLVPRDHDISPLLALALKELFDWGLDWYRRTPMRIREFESQVVNTGRTARQQRSFGKGIESDIPAACALA